MGNKAQPTRIANTREIKVALAKKEINQTILSERLKINRQYLNSLITGKRRISSSNAIVTKIADFLEVPVDSIFPQLDLESIFQVNPLDTGYNKKASDKMQQKINFFKKNNHTENPIRKKDDK